MSFTYTYTARNKEDANQVLTFTIVDDHVRVDLTGMIDQVSDIFDEDHPKSAITDYLGSQAGAALYKVIERLSGPVHLSDVNVSLTDNELTLTFWKRLAGLRVAPLTLSMGVVDNPEAAEQFVETLIERQERVASPGFFSGPLDYWVTWFALVAGLIVLIKWPKKKPE